MVVLDILRHTHVRVIYHVRPGEMACDGEEIQLLGGECDRILDPSIAIAYATVVMDVADEGAKPTDLVI